MADGDADPLLAWAFATFHVTLLTVGGVLVGRAVADLGAVLGETGTARGVVLFALLWGTAWATNRRVLAGLPVDWREWTVRRVVARGLLWGGATGAAFLVELVAAVSLFDPPSGPVTATAVGQLLVLLALGAAAAGAVGAFVGGILAAADVVLVRAASVAEWG